MAATESISFQELWQVAAGRSCMKDAKLVGEELNARIPILKDGLRHYKSNSNESKTKLKNDKNVPSDLQSFSFKVAEFLDLDCMQAADMVKLYSRCDFHGSEEKFNEMLKDERSHMALLGKVAEYYFAERLYLIRTIKHVLSYFEDKGHKFQKEYMEVIDKLQGLGTSFFNDYEKQFSSDPPTSKTRGTYFTAQVVAPFAVQALKEQCELLEVLFLYYSHFEMSLDVLVLMAKTFKAEGFGAGHPLLEVVDTNVLAPLLNRINALQQVILIEGFDMDYLQRLAEADGVDQHRLSVKKSEFQQLDKIFVTLTESALSPVMLAWATIRYQVMAGRGSEVTQRLGERAIENKVWTHLMQIVDLYPFESELPAALASRNVLRGLMSCVTHSFHEDTLGDYIDLVNAAAKVVAVSKEASEAFWSEKKQGTGLHLLLNSASGYFPLHLTPMIKILAALATGRVSSLEVYRFVSNLPAVAEYLAARGTDDVESTEDGSSWKLLANKSLAVAGGFHSIKIPMGAVGSLVDTQVGAMVQWQTSANGWEYFLAEIESLLQYRGQSSDLEVLGFVDKANLIYGLIERLLDSAQTFPSGRNKTELLDTMDTFIEKIPALIQRLINMSNPPQDLIALCIRCLTSWVKCDSASSDGVDSNLSAAITALLRIQFLPFADRDFMENLVSAAKYPLHYVSELSTPVYPGIFGGLLANAERPTGHYPITLSTLDLVLTLVERSIAWKVEDDGETRHNRNIITAIAPSVLFFLKEVFPTFYKWRRESDSSGEIGLKCLSLCHIVLRSYDPRSQPTVVDPSGKSEGSDNIWSPVQHMTLTILTHSNSVDIILKLVSIPVEAVHTLLSSDPTSPAVTHVMETLRYGFSVLNNILRLEHNAASSTAFEETAGSKTEEFQAPSYLHTVLSAHSTGTPNVISLVAGYLYHRHNVLLPRIALSLLRRISVAVPMSLHASLGADVAAVRDILLTRLKARTEDLHLKIGILDFLTISVQTQPSLLELFLDLEPVEKDNPGKGLKLGKASCLTAVLDLIHAEMQGTFQLPAELHAACVKLLSSLWVDRRHSALKALRTYSSTQKIKATFWHSLLLPLFSDNSPKEIAQSDLLETCAHILNTLGLENFYTTPSGKDPTLTPLMKQFTEKDRYNHWSKVMVCVSKTLPRLTVTDSESRLMFLAAWRTFVLTSKITDPAIVKKFVDDIMMALGALVADMDVHGGIKTALNLTSSLLLSLIHKCPKNTLVDFATTQKLFSRIVGYLKDVGVSKSTPDRYLVHLQAISLHLYSRLFEYKEQQVKFSPTVCDWLRLSCQNLKGLLRDGDKKGKKMKNNVETSMLFIQALHKVYPVDDQEENASSWLKIIHEESTFNLLASVLMQLISSAHLEDEENVLRASLSSSILRLFVGVCHHSKTSLAILNTGIWQEFCLKISNAYADSEQGKRKKWINVYHLSLLFFQKMLDNLSHTFLDHALDFVGVHNDRIVECLDAVHVKQGPNILREAAYATALLSSLSKNFVREWRFKLLHSYQLCLEKVASLCHSCVAMLLRPRLLMEAIERASKKESTASVPAFGGSSTSMRQTSVVAQKSLSQDDLDVPSPKFLSAQHGLFSILGNCLAVFKHLSPDMCQVLLDQSIDPEEFQPLLLIGFSMPSLDQISPPTFGTIVNAANVAWKVLSKPGATSPVLRDIALYVMDTALTVAIAQGSLLLKHPHVTHRDKQRLRRELGDELISCLRSANRHYRHSSGSATSPQTSPLAGSKSLLAGRSSLTKQFPGPSGSTPQNSATSPTIDRGMLDLTDMFVKQVLR